MQRTPSLPSRRMWIGSVVACLIAGCGQKSEPASAPAAPTPSADAKTPPAGTNVTESPTNKGSVQFKTTDGATIDAAWRPATGTAKLSVVLAPILSRTREDYDGVAAHLNGRQCNTLAISLRGHGESTAPNGKKYDQFSTQEWLAATADLEAAVNYAKTQAPNVPVVLLGASITANLALNYAAAHNNDIAGLVLLSPSLDYHGVTTDKAMAGLGGLPVLIAWASGDKQSATGCEQLVKLHGQTQLTQGTYPGSDHGTALLDHSSGLQAALDHWLEDIRA